MTKQAPSQNVERFPTRKKALDWLKEHGYKISTGKFYGDCDKGYPPVAKDGSLSKFQVLEYGLALERKLEPDQEAINRKEWQDRKEKADAKMAEMKAERMRRDEDSLWLHADEAWSAVAGIVGTLRDCIRHHLYTNQGEVVMTAGGEQERSQEVFEFMDELVSKAFNEVAGDSIEVEFEKEKR